MQNYIIIIHPIYILCLTQVYKNAEKSDYIYIYKLYDMNEIQLFKREL